MNHRAQGVILTSPLVVNSALNTKHASLNMTAHRAQGVVLTEQMDQPSIFHKYTPRLDTMDRLNRRWHEMEWLIT